MEKPPHADGELSEGEIAILELEAQLRRAQEARHSRGTSRSFAVRPPGTSSFY